MKTNLLISQTDLNSFCADWVIPILSETFNVIWHEDNHTHDPDNTVLITKSFRANSADAWHTPLQQQGYRVIVDYLWDAKIQDKTQRIGNKLILHNANWPVWYHESLWYHHLGYHTYQPNPNHTRAFLLLMNLAKQHRDLLFDKVQNLLPNAVYSYVERGHVLEDDTATTNPNWQRFFNPKWYNTTAFSLVAESVISQPAEISEKCFKPLAFGQPMIVWGSTGLLDYIRSQDFLTFDNVIDESYDRIEDHTARLNKICDIVSDLTDRFQSGEPLFQDAETQRRLAHNRARFFDKQLVVDRIRKEIIQDILNFIQ